ncbi:hypothetical protein BD410DRAFT_105317 [Rickenella mellea]|uniref:G domain-containing protein n=1 Tax=Rickenella mellea TaxID=50990 RepID=A0A4Y7PJ70_9AGAM|nr:hypothetical protein BD410DRAFT_105317 [Rickenella mellea]
MGNRALSRDPGSGLLRVCSLPFIYGKEQTPVTFCTEETNRENWWRFQRIPDGNDDQIASRADADPPRYVAVVGATVSGISSFVNDAAGSKLDAGDDFNSRSDRVHATQILLDGRPVVLLEISGFGHSSMSDIEPLHSMADYLSRKKIELTGILYMQSISIANVVRSPLRSVAMFRKLCEHIWIVTTDWHDVESRVGRVREQEIMDVFQPLVRARGRMVRHDQAGRSARAILRRVLEKDVIVLRIQAELVDVCKDLPVTSAGAEISSALRRALATGEMVSKLRDLILPLNF